MASNVWNDILARIETKVNRHSFYTWFKPTRLVDETVPSPSRVWADAS